MHLQALCTRSAPNRGKTCNQIDKRQARTAKCGLAGRRQAYSVRAAAAPGAAGAPAPDAALGISAAACGAADSGHAATDACNMQGFMRLKGCAARQASRLWLDHMHVPAQSRMRLPQRTASAHSRMALR